MSGVPCLGFRGWGVCVVVCRSASVGGAGRWGFRGARRHHPAVLETGGSYMHACLLGGYHKVTDGYASLLGISQYYGGKFMSGRTARPEERRVPSTDTSQ